MHFLVRLLMSAFALLISTWMLPGVELFPEGGTESLLYAMLVAFVIGLLNAFVRPLLVFLTLPATLITFGLFLWVINALLILLADAMLSGFEVRNFWWALLFSLIYTFIMAVFERMSGMERKRRRE